MECSRLCVIIATCIILCLQGCHLGDENKRRVQPYSIVTRSLKQASHLALTRTFSTHAQSTIASGVKDTLPRAIATPH